MIGQSLSTCLNWNGGGKVSEKVWKNCNRVRGEVSKKVWKIVIE